MRELLISAISGLVGGYLGVWVTMLIITWMWPRGIVRDGS